MNGFIDWINGHGSVFLASLGLAAVIVLPVLLDRDDR